MDNQGDKIEKVPLLKHIWKFEHRLASGFGLTLLLTALTAGSSFVALRAVTKSMNIVVFDHSQDLFEVNELRIASQKKSSASRGYFISGDSDFLNDLEQSETSFWEAFSRLEKKVSGPESKPMLLKLQKEAREYQTALNNTIAVKRAGGSARRVSELFENEVTPQREALDQALATFVEYKKNLFETGKNESRSAVKRAMSYLLIVAGVSILLTIFLAIIVTITLSRLYRISQKSIQAREELLAAISHDLKNPLGTISLASELLLRTIGKDDNQKTIEKQVGMVRRASHQMEHLVGNLLQLERLEAGRFVVDIATHDINSLLDQVVENHLLLARQKSIEIRKYFKSDLRSVQIDRDQMIRVLSNLIGNAIKFTGEGGLITLRAEVDEKAVRFFVTDTGRGMTQEQILHVFDRYYQAKRTDRAFGEGLGLSIVKGIVQAHGGSVRVESELGSGSTFIVEVPQRDPAQQLGLTRVQATPEHISGETPTRRLD